MEAMPYHKKLFGLSNQEEQEIQILTGKWIAILLKGKRTGDPEVVRENGLILADENPIEVQNKISELYPDLAARNERGKYIHYGYVSPKTNLNF